MDKVAWITGCTRGLGRAMTIGLIKNGWTVCGCARSVPRIDELRSAFPAPNHFAPADVTDDTIVEAWVHGSLKATRAPDLLINNAATMNTSSPLWEVASADFANVIDVNIKGVHNVIRHAVPAMILRQTGIIVNLSSGWGRSTSPNVAPYCASKFAIEGLSSAMAQELPEGMACVAVSPGVIDTDMLRKSWGDAAADHQSVNEWAQSAIPFLENLSAADNGKSLSIT